MIQPNRTTLLRSALLLAVATTTACGGAGEKAADTAAATASSTPAASSRGDEDLADVSEYELSMDKLDRYFAAQRNIALKAKDLSPAEREAMEAKDDDDDSSLNQSLDDMARKIEGQPLMRDAIREAGLSAREFATLTMSLLQTGMAASVLDMRPNDNQDSLTREMKANPANIRWYREHKAEIERKQTELAAEMERLGVASED
jgi:hypothetical protein